MLRLQGKSLWGTMAWRLKLLGNTVPENSLFEPSNLVHLGAMQPFLTWILDQASAGATVKQGSLISAVIAHCGKAI